MIWIHSLKSAGVQENCEHGFAKEESPQEVVLELYGRASLKEYTGKCVLGAGRLGWCGWWVGWLGGCGWLCLVLLFCATDMISEM